jgi:hypothetical protein
VLSKVRGARVAPRPSARAMPCPALPRQAAPCLASPCLAPPRVPGCPSQSEALGNAADRLRAELSAQQDQRATPKRSVHPGSYCSPGGSLGVSRIDAVHAPLWVATALGKQHRGRFAVVMLNRTYVVIALRACSAASMRSASRLAISNA